MLPAALLWASALLIHLSLFPTAPLLIAAPFCCLALQQKGKVSALWIAALCGLVYDLLVFDPPFGLFSLCHTLALGGTACFQKIHPIRHLALLTGVFSMIYWSLYPLLFQSHPDLAAATCRILLLPIVHSLYAFCWFTYPLMLYTPVYGAHRHDL